MSSLGFECGGAEAVSGAALFCRVVGSTRGGLDMPRPLSASARVAADLRGVTSALETEERRGLSRVPR